MLYMPQRQNGHVFLRHKTLKTFVTISSAESESLVNSESLSFKFSISILFSRIGLLHVTLSMFRSEELEKVMC